MAARGSSSSSDHASISVQENLAASNDGSLEDRRVDDELTTTEAEGSSFTRQLSNSQTEKGEAITKDEEMVGETVSTSENLEVDEMDGEGVECSCCYREFQSENVVQCGDGHQLCFECIERQVNEILYGGVRAQGSLPCFAADEDCKESIPLSEISKAVPNDVVERYEYRQAQDALAEARIENLIYCPFCNIPYEIDNCAQVLDCPNPKCLKSSCIQCKGLSHLPLRCEEVDEKSAETALRRQVEERMARAVIRECNVCKAAIVKSGGCNVMTCRCGNRMCYICRQTTSFGHFCFCRPRIGEPGKPCPKCKKCSTYETEIEDNEALAAREEALKEMAVINPDLHGLEIGPPLEWVKRKPSTELHSICPKLFRPCQVRPPQEYKSHSYENEIEDKETLAAKVEAIKERLRMKPGLVDLEIGPPLNRLTRQPYTERQLNHPCEIRPPQEFNVQSDQLTNHPSEIRPPEEFKVHGDEFNVHGYEHANRVVPPPLPRPQLLEHGDQVANTHVPRSSPPRESLEHGGHISNHGVPPQFTPRSS